KEWVIPQVQGVGKVLATQAIRRVRGAVIHLEQPVVPEQVNASAPVAGKALILQVPAAGKV
ncbi:MAG: hypothetical protein HY594_03365, partial [Candidatus Omnitrophica bacterium]|nr:hypothetical protein [Candidatus Omnitrophota bacterium]